MTIAPDNFASSPMLALMNQKIVAVGDGTATVTAQPEAKFENQMGRMHGGYVATLIDTVMGRAVMTKLPDETGLGTIDLNVKFIRKVDVSTGLLIATANVVHSGRTLFTVEARVADSNGKLYAHGSGTFLVYPKQDT